MLVNKAGRNERSLGSQTEVGLCVHLMPGRQGYTTKVRTKALRKMLCKGKYHMHVHVLEKI